MERREKFEIGNKGIREQQIKEEPKGRLFSRDQLVFESGNEDTDRRDLELFLGTEEQSSNGS